MLRQTTRKIAMIIATVVFSCVAVAACGSTGSAGNDAIRAKEIAATRAVVTTAAEKTEATTTTKSSTETTTSKSKTTTTTTTTAATTTAEPEKTEKVTTTTTEPTTTTAATTTAEPETSTKLETSTESKAETTESATETIESSAPETTESEATTGTFTTPSWDEPLSVEECIKWFIYYKMGEEHEIANIECDEKNDRVIFTFDNGFMVDVTGVVNTYLEGKKTTISQYVGSSSIDYDYSLFFFNS